MYARKTQSISFLDFFMCNRKNRDEQRLITAKNLQWISMERMNYLPLNITLNFY